MRHLRIRLADAVLRRGERRVTNQLPRRLVARPRSDRWPRGASGSTSSSLGWLLHERSRASPAENGPDPSPGVEGKGRKGSGDRGSSLSAPVAFYVDPGEAPTPRAIIDRDGYLPALRLEVVPQGCRQGRGHVPGEHLIVLLRGERNEVSVRLLPIHLQHVGTMGDVLEAGGSTAAGLAAQIGSCGRGYGAGRKRRLIRPGERGSRWRGTWKRRRRRAPAQCAVSHSTQRKSSEAMRRSNTQRAENQAIPAASNAAPQGPVKGWGASREAESPEDEQRSVRSSKIAK
jgi:hypothetical protein